MVDTAKNRCNCRYRIRKKETFIEFFGAFSWQVSSEFCPTGRTGYCHLLSSILLFTTCSTYVFICSLKHKYLKKIACLRIPRSVGIKTTFCPRNCSEAFDSTAWRVAHTHRHNAVTWPLEWNPTLRLHHPKVMKVISLSCPSFWWKCRFTKERYATP